MNKYFLILVFALLVFISPSFALAENVTDQVCYGDPLGQGRPVPIRFTLHGQVFRPTVSHISKIAIFAKSSDKTAKVRLKIQKAWWGQNLPTYEKVVVLNQDPWWVEADFSEAVVTPGADYFLTVEPLNDAAIDWYINDDANCNPAGYAFVGGNIERDKDFYFLTRGSSDVVELQVPVDSTAQEVPSESNPVEPNSASTTDSSENVATSDSTSSGQTSSSSNSSSSAAKSSSANNKSAQSYVTDKEIATSNKVAESTGKISDAEVEEVLKMIAEDYANRRRGMFGLSGAVGSLLTPMVFYSAVAIVLVLILISIIRAIRKRRKLNSSSANN